MYYLHKTPSLLKKLFPDVLWDTSSLTSHDHINLTFDDGPNNNTTERILNILYAYRIKATFFCVGENITNNRKIFEMLLEHGHPVGNHTYTHRNGWSTPTKEYLKDIEKCQIILDSYNVRNKYFRPPYGRLKPGQYKGLLKEGHKIVMWDVLSGDFDTQLSSDQVLKSSLKATKPGSIIVFHDNIKYIGVVEKILPAYIEGLLGLGFKFTTLWD